MKARRCKWRSKCPHRIRPPVRLRGSPGRMRMSESGVTLGELLNVDGDTIRAAINEHLKANPGQRSLPTAVLTMAAADGAKAVTEQLDVDLFELIFKAWAA